MGRYERVKQGETLETVLADAQAAAEQARATTPRRTLPDTPGAAKSKKNLKTGQKKK